MPVLKRLLAGVDVRVDLVLAPEGEDCGSAVNLCFASMKHVAFRTDPDIMRETACSEPGATVFGIHNTTSEILCLEQMRDVTGWILSRKTENNEDRKEGRTKKEERTKPKKDEINKRESNVSLIDSSQLAAQLLRAE